MPSYKKSDDGGGFAVAFVVILILLLMLAHSRNSHGAEVPNAAFQYRTDMLQSAWRTFGPGAPVAVLAAQIHQESSWKIDARSWAGAEGFAQFMPGTAADMANRYPELCAPANPFSAKWAFNCRDKYLQLLITASTNDSTSECSQWAFGLGGYNGGLTWAFRDRRAAAEGGANPDDWREVAPFNAGRKPSAFRENREYPVRIFRLQEAYNFWGRGLDC